MGQPLVVKVSPIPNTDRLLIIQDTTLKSTTPVFSPKWQVLGVWVGELDIDTIILLEEIIRRESGGNPKVCNKKYGCRAGMGLTQLIPSTVKYCEEKLGKEIDPFDPIENLECAIWLLQNEGIRHWEPYSGPYETN